MVDDQSVATGNANDIRDKYEKMKNVFNLLIREAPYLIDDKSMERCNGLPLKEQFSIQIDAIRRSLGIENMDDVITLVDTFYGFTEFWEKKLQVEREAEEELSENGNGDEEHAGNKPNEDKNGAKNGHAAAAAAA